MLLPVHLTRALTLVLSTATAQAGASPSTVLAQQDQPVRREITIEVRNDNFHDATVYAIRFGLRQRLGWVGGFGKDTFKFRWPTGDLRIEIDLLANGRYYTHVMDVNEDDELQLTILPYLHRMPPGTVF